MMQARQLGKELYVGVHSDEEILLNKGPTVMKLDERLTAVDACKWSTKAITNAPYVTSPDFMEEHGCKYVVHGDDITTDANGNDCYQEVKDLGKFVVVKRTPNISTTDLVGRMLLMSKSHHFRPITEKYESHAIFEGDNLDKFKNYATDATGLKPHSGVYINIDELSVVNIIAPSTTLQQKYSNAVYVDGGFDLFHPGHIEALKLVHEEARKTDSTVIVGIHDDATINKYKGLNFPIMNLFERSMCVLQCRYVDAVVLGAPYSPTKRYLAALLEKLPGKVNAVFHGPTPFDDYDPYQDVKPLLKQIKPHRFDNMNTDFIVSRVLDNKQAFEDRQRKKGWKSERELKLAHDERTRLLKGEVNSQN